MPASTAFQPARAPVISKQDYTTAKANVAKKKKELKEKYNHGKLSNKDLEEAFITLITDSIFPYWYGTTWNFYGTTRQPGTGTIACGYFVTTTLEDAGVTLQRVKLAQCASQKIIKSLITKNKTTVFSNAPFQNFLSHLKKEGKGLYIVGLDSHVGFIFNDSTDIYFIHAKWANPKAVVKEPAVTSGILSGSKYKIIGKLSSDEVFLKRWVMHQ